MDENANHLPAIREFVSELGVAPESVGWNYVQSVGRGNDQPEAQVNRDKSDEQSNHGSSNRRFNPGKLCVTYRGEVVPCIFQRWLQLGNVHDRSLRNVVTDPKPEQINQDIPSGQLAENSYTCGECRFHYQFLRELVGV
jgi:radical SAM protein with 4Fe4S-binding SPASM domain